MEKKPKWIYICIIVAILIQLSIPLSMLFKREMIVSTAPRVWLNVGPVDPIDPFRGEYVTLSYDAENVANAMCDTSFQTGNIYISLKVDSENLATPYAVSETFPDSGLTLKATYKSYSYFSRVDFKIGKLFVQMGKGPEIESNIQRISKPNIVTYQSSIMDVEVAIGSDGTPVLTGNYRFKNPVIRVKDDDLNFVYIASNITEKEQSFILSDGLPKCDVFVRYTTWNNGEKVEFTHPVYQTPKDSVFSSLSVLPLQTHEASFPLKKEDFLLKYDMNENKWIKDGDVDEHSKKILYHGDLIIRIYPDPQKDVYIERSFSGYSLR